MLVLAEVVDFGEGRGGSAWCPAKMPENRMDDTCILPGRILAARFQHFSPNRVLTREKSRYSARNHSCKVPGHPSYRSSEFQRLSSKLVSQLPPPNARERVVRYAAAAYDVGRFVSPRHDAVTSWTSNRNMTALAFRLHRSVAFFDRRHGTQFEVLSKVLTIEGTTQRSAE
jgi:hypothetical protein